MTEVMQGSRGGPTCDDFVLLFLVDEGREDPNTTKIGPLLAQQLGPPGKPVLLRSFVAL